MCKDKWSYIVDSNISDATGSGAKSAIGYQVDAGCDDLEISGNKISFKGTDTRTVTANIDGIRQNASAGSVNQFCS